MMTNWGSVPASSVLPYFFHTFNSTGASVTISNFALADIAVYKGTSMTQRSSTAGIVLLDTDGIDLDGTTGIQGFSIDLSDNTDAGFYAVGSFYTVVVGPITVNANTVNFVAGTFRIIAAENTAGFQAVDAAKWNNLATVELPLVPTTAGRKLDVSAGGEAGVDWANVGGPTTAVDLSGTTIKTTQVVASVTGAVGSVTGAVGSVTGNVGGNVTGTVGSVVGAVGSVTGNVGGNVVGSVASVTAGVTLAANAVTAAALAADAGAEIADAILDRDMSTGADSGSTTVRTPRQALRFLRNKWDIAAGTLTVKKEDDATTSWTSVMSTDAAAVPIIGTDPAGP